jgi:deoxyribodipyrimidine photo-lyase
VRNETSKRILLWFRNDLRLTDHEPYAAAVQSGAEVLPVYCIDPVLFEETPFGFTRAGTHRLTFLRECIQALAEELAALGGQLYVTVGKPEQVLPELCRSYHVQQVYAAQEEGTEEQATATRTEKALQALQVPVNWFAGNFLIHPEDLPFPVKQVPEVFTEFRKKAERDLSIRTCCEVYATPRFIAHQLTNDFGELQMQTQDVQVPFFTGGSRAAKERLSAYVWQTDGLRVYKETRNGLLGEHFSSRFSPWLATGCISAREIWHEVKRYEHEVIANSSTYWLIFELMWRDYFRFMLRKHGGNVFTLQGIQQTKQIWSEDRTAFEQWRTGQTGVPLVDAAMRELLATGFMSNRARQNAASFLTKTMGINWLWGAAWFEHALIDYDVASNYGNWNYVAGVGNDPRNRTFNVYKQAREYDKDAKYIKNWIKELEQADTGEIMRDGFKYM